jgi:hypothetical protein
VHGNLFDPVRVRFSGDADVYAGCLSSAAALRDYDPEHFLTSLIWNTRGERQVFQFSPRDKQRIGAFIASDGNAQISVVTGAWAVPLFNSNQDFHTIRKTAALLQKQEIDFVNILRRVQTRAEVKIWSLAEFVEEPMENLQSILDAIGGPSSGARITEAPRMVDLSGFGQFLQNLKNQGMNPHVTGDFPVNQPGMQPRSGGSRPYLVR